MDTTQQNDFTLNKLILLYVIREKGLISRPDLSDYVIYHKYMDYFQMDQLLTELEASRLIFSTDSDRQIRYSITHQGSETLDLFQLRIPHSVRREILEYAEIDAIERSSTMGLDVSLEQESDGRYAVTCYVRDYDTHLFELVFHVSSKQEAAEIRRRWLERGLVLYRNLMNGLNSDS